MLVLSRLRDEAVMIGDDIQVMVVDIRGEKVRLGIDAPQQVTVHRKEVYDAIRREKPPFVDPLSGRTLHQCRVLELMERAQQDTPTAPIIPDKEIRKLRAMLILEEALETIKGLGFNASKTPGEPFYLTPSNEPPNLVEIVDGCLDLEVVSTGTLIACGIRDKKLLEEVDKNNLDKFRGDAHRNAEGKWVKPSDHQPPKIEELIAQQVKGIY